MFGKNFTSIGAWELSENCPCFWCIHAVQNLCFLRKCLFQFLPTTLSSKKLVAFLNVNEFSWDWIELVLLSLNCPLQPLKLLANFENQFLVFGLFVTSIGAIGSKDWGDSCLKWIYTRNLHWSKGGVGKMMWALGLCVMEGGTLTPFILVWKSWLLLIMCMLSLLVDLWLWKPCYALVELGGIVSYKLIDYGMWCEDTLVVLESVWAYRICMPFLKCENLERSWVWWEFMDEEYYLSLEKNFLKGNCVFKMLWPKELWNESKLLKSCVHDI